MGSHTPEGRNAAGRRGAPPVAAALGMSVALCIAGCAYQYDDGLAPLGRRDASAQASASASAAADASASASAAARDLAGRTRSQRGAATEAPFGQLLGGTALQAWADTVLPDDSGLSAGSDASAVWPDKAPYTMGIDTDPGPATLRFACRGIGLASVRVTADEAPLLDITFACNRAWSRAVAVPSSGHLEVQFSAAGDAASDVAYRLTRP
ncbi:hypothetical protein [Sinomonas sp. P10A9]|uniref:Uncharacterized protein n=1 Tax=Sinomonas puerhi TaxID=3238584 RepID=A0AB39L2D3_9MICC